MLYWSYSLSYRFISFLIKVYPSFMPFCIKSINIFKNFPHNYHSFLTFLSDTNLKMSYQTDKSPNKSDNKQDYNDGTQRWVVLTINVVIVEVKYERYQCVNDSKVNGTKLFWNFIIRSYYNQFKQKNGWKTQCN